MCGLRHSDSRSCVGFYPFTVQIRHTNYSISNLMYNILHLNTCFWYVISIWKTVRQHMCACEELQWCTLKPPYPCIMHYIPCTHVGLRGGGVDHRVGFVRKCGCLKNGSVGNVFSIKSSLCLCFTYVIISRA